MADGGLADAMENLCVSPEGKASLAKYSQQLRRAVRRLRTPSEEWRALENEWNTLENDLTQRYSNGQYLNYLDIDPRITQNLPDMGEESEKFECFLSAIFYVGKGTSTKPRDHMHAALKESETKNDHIKRIQAIWNDNRGVVRLSIFENRTTEEAMNRKAAMIEAIGKGNLCNDKRGTFTGPIVEWANIRKCQLGAGMLYSAFKTYLDTEVREIRRDDVQRRGAASP